MRTCVLFALALGLCLAAGHAEVLAQDAASGAKVFSRMCQACHALEPGKHKMGPSLAGVVGREAGSLEGYEYSEAMRNSGMVWTGETLAAYLANPRAVVPGNRMVFPGLKDGAQIRDLIAHLERSAK